MAFQPLYSETERHEKTVDVFRNGLVVTGTSQGGEGTIKLEMSAAEQQLWQ